MKSTTSFLIILLLCLVSCKETNKEQAALYLDKNEDPLHDTALVNKYNAYVAVSNYVSPAAQEAEIKYVECVDTKTGVLRAGMTFSPFLNTDRPYELQKMETYIVKGPKMDGLDKSAALYLEAYQNLHKVIRELIDYYDINDHEKDNYEKAKKLNPTVLEAFEKFASVDSLFNAQIEIMDKNFIKLELESYKTNGKEVLYAHTMLIEHMREHLQYTSQYDYTTMNKINFEVYDKKTDTIVTAFKMFNDLAKNEEILKKEVRNPHFLSIFNNKVADYIKMSQQISEVGKDKKEFDLIVKRAGRMGKQYVKVSPEKLSKAFGELIKESNRMK